MDQQAEPEHDPVRSVMQKLIADLAKEEAARKSRRAQREAREKRRVAMKIAAELPEDPDAVAAILAAAATFHAEIAADVEYPGVKVLPDGSVTVNLRDVDDGAKETHVTNYVPDVKPEPKRWFAYKVGEEYRIAPINVYEIPEDVELLPSDTPLPSRSMDTGPLIQAILSLGLGLVVAPR